VLVPFRTDTGRSSSSIAGGSPRAMISPSRTRCPPRPPAGDRRRASHARRAAAQRHAVGAGRTGADDQSAAHRRADRPRRCHHGAYGLMASEEPAPATVPNALESPSDDPVRTSRTRSSGSSSR
jgi:hypothetical protein